MDPEQHIDNEPKPVAESPVAPAPSDNRRPPGRGRGRFKRGGRGGRGRDDRGDRPPRSEQPRHDGGESLPRRPSGNIGDAIHHVEHIRAELVKVMADIEDVLQTLELVERDQSASEEEIEKLRDALRSVHREPSYPRNPRYNPPPPRSSAPPAPPEQPAAEPEPPDDLD